MKKLLLILIILFISGTALVKPAYANTGQTNITTKFPQVMVITTIPSMFATEMSTNITPLEKIIMPFAFLLFLFTMAIKLYTNQEGGYMKEIFWLIFIISLLIMYNVIWVWLETVIDGIASGIMPEAEYMAFVKLIFSKPTPPLTLWNWFNPDLWLGAVSVIIAGLAEWVILLLRYILLAFMYLAGPIVISLSIIPSLRSLLKAWIINTIEIMSWTITLALLYSVFNGVLNGSINYPSLNNSDIIVTTAFMILFIILVILAPMLTSKLYKGGMGAIGSVASAITTTIITGGIAAGAGAAGIAGGGLAGGVGAKMAGSGAGQAARGMAGKTTGAARHAAENANQHKFHPYRKKKSNDEEE
jgi:hypothetical protein